MNRSLFQEYEKVFEEKEPAKEKAAPFYAYSPFALQDAIGEKNIKKTWIEYQKLRLSGVEADELIHKIISKVRDMTSISQGASKEDLGMKDYPFNKSKKDLKNWKPQNLNNFYGKLVEIYHLSRISRQNDFSSEAVEVETALEKVLLNI